MFESIIEEINGLISCIRRKIEQNQRLLSRLTEADQILGVTDPAAIPNLRQECRPFHSFDGGSLNLNERLASLSSKRVTLENIQEQRSPPLPCEDC